MTQIEAHLRRAAKHRVVTILALGTVGLAVVAGLVGCSAENGARASTVAKPSVVASTDVWGDIAREIGGTDVVVTSFVNSTSQDPHEYQSTGRDQLALSKASVIIENGGGYDDFMEQLRAASKPNAPVLNAVKISGVTAPAGGDLNEHVWYLFPAVDRVAQKLANELGKVDPAHASVFEHNYRAFAAKLAPLSAKLAAVAPANTGKGALVSEPVPMYMLEAAGLKNLTPTAFSNAVEAGNDVAPIELQRTLALVSSQKVAIIGVNTQSGAETVPLVAAGKSAGVPVVAYAETLPAGASYLTWMTENVDRTLAALKE